MRGVLVTGTDTGVGKTFVACGLAAALARRGTRVGVMKPVETGCRERDGVLVPEDAARLKFFSGCEASMETICPCRFPAPRAPWVAALEEGREVDTSLLKKSYQSILSGHDLTLVEGAGGVMVPIGENFNFADLAREWGLSVMLVTTAKLGTLNHTLLSLEYLRHRGIKVLGYLMNVHEPTASELVSSNINALERLSAEPFLGQIPHQVQQGEFSPARTPPERLASLFEDSLRWGRIEEFLATAQEKSHGVSQGTAKPVA